MLSPDLTLRTKLRVHQRWLVRSDLARVLAIDDLTSPAPWTENRFKEVLRERNCIGYVAEHGEQVVGYQIYELFRHEIHLVRLAVHPAWQRRSIGSQMLARLIAKLNLARRIAIRAMVREHQDAAIMMLSHAGFRAVQVVRDAYTDPAEDGYLFRASITALEEEPPDAV